MPVWEALGFMFLGGAIVWLFDLRSFVMYQKGRREGEKRNVKEVKKP